MFCLFVFFTNEYNNLIPFPALFVPVISYNSILSTGKLSDKDISLFVYTCKRFANSLPFIIILRFIEFSNILLSEILLFIS